MLALYAIQNAIGDLAEEGFSFDIGNHSAVINEYKKRLRECGYDVKCAVLDINNDIIYARIKAD